MLNNIPFDFLLNLFLVGLLLATIGYCAVLNRRLSAMRDAHTELQRLSEEFDKAIVRSKVGVEELKSLAEVTGRKFTKEIEQAQGLIEELQLINASSSRIADRLQQGVESSALKTAAPRHFEDGEVGFFDHDVSEKKPAEAPSGKVRSEAERELLNMLTKST